MIALYHLQNITCKTAIAYQVCLSLKKTEQRDKIQQAYNEQHDIAPRLIQSRVHNSILNFLDISLRLNSQPLEQIFEQADDLSLEQIPELIQQLEPQRKEATKKLECEMAAEFRDRIQPLRDQLLGHR